MSANLPFDYNYVLDRPTTTRLRQSYLRYAFTRPTRFIPLCVFVLVSAVLGSQIVSPGISPIIGVAFGSAIAGLLIAIVFGTLYGATSKSLKSIVTDNSCSATFGISTITFRGAIGTSELEYYAFQRVFVRDSTLFLQSRGNRQFILMPAERIPSSVVGAVKTKIASAVPL